MPPPMLDRCIEILLVEDNPGDVRLTQEAMKEGDVRNHMEVVGDGVEAMAYLRREGLYTGKPRPDFILLDLNLPRKDGREVLEEIKADPELKRIPVMVMTTSEAEQDIQRVYDLHANCYITKPVDLEHFLEAIKTIKEFWFRVARLPVG
jgi:chemotaxis family two-component system response regulator Rcp1